MPNQLSSIAQMPEWYLILAAMLLLTGLGAFWEPLLMLWPLVAVTAGSSLVHAILSARQAPLRGFIIRCLVGWLHLLQPLARLYGRMGSGLTPWRRLPARSLGFPGWRHVTIWSESWRPAMAWLESVEKSLQTPGAVVSRGGAFDRWDLELRGGALGSVRMRTALEEHGQGKQLLRVCIWPHWAWPGLLITIVCGAVAVAAARDQAWPATIVFASTALCCLVATIEEWCIATGMMLRVLRGVKTASEVELQPKSKLQGAAFPSMPVPRAFS
ncbi:MAG TPA: hypothetical protein VN673_17280 [Clostridia bacterium]|nr:hypothetical protein [Clostridia bacterium]